MRYSHVSGSRHNILGSYIKRASEAATQNFARQAKHGSRAKLIMGNKKLRDADSGLMPIKKFGQLFSSYQGYRQRRWLIFQRTSKKKRRPS
jgi:hypothetical protein